MNLDLGGKRVLVTGGSEGIGLACAKAFAKEGCEVLTVARRSATGALTLSLDLTLEGAPQRLLDWAGEVDILVNNAGAIPGGDLFAVDEAAWRRGWELKVFGYINLSRLAYARMKVRGGGVIVNVIGHTGEKLDASYIAGSTGNAGLIAFTRALGGVSMRDGVRVVGVSPGPVATERLNAVYSARAASLLGDPRRSAELMTDLPLGRPAHPAEIADTVVFLASPRSAYTSGCVLTIDGGLASRAQ